MAPDQADMEEPIQGDLSSLSTVRATPVWTMMGRPKTVEIAENAPAPGHYGLPDISAQSCIKRPGSVLILSGPRGGPTTFKGKAPDPCAYDVKLRDSPTGRLAARAERFRPRKPDDEPGPGEYPAKKCWDAPKISIHGRFETRCSSAPDLMGPTRYSPKPEFVKEKVPACRLDLTSKRNGFFAAREDTPGPGSYNASFDGLSSNKRVLGRAWKPPTMATAKGSPKHYVYEGGGKFCNYTLFVDKSKKAKPAA
eukprot:gb/GFBE01062866.1/.p1 GENE.gb/GFBE01062866.1/~~gb/GFBE01062866.1/.p1  ORF type:complete len:252 (+),score=41.86 gb/GFBE01062866.1/:1-756(+)